jgi:hypothetical protein
MNSQEIRAIREAYTQVYEQETGRGPRISDTYDMRDAEGGPRGGGTIKGSKIKNVIRKEEIDLFDYILEHLVAEGYADTNEAALAIMANMSEEWRQSIVEQLNPDAPGNTHSLADLYKAQEKWQRDQEKKKKEPKSGGSGAASQVKGV